MKENVTDSRSRDAVHASFADLTEGAIPITGESVEASLDIFSSGNSDRILELITDAIIAVDVQLRVVYWSRGAASLFALEASQAIGRDINTIVVGCRDGSHLGSYADRFTTSIIRAVRADVVLVLADGRSIEIEQEIKPLVSEDGARQGFVVTLRDITDHLAREQSILESAERFELLTRATKDILWDFDPEKNVLWWNRGFSESFGYEESEIESDVNFWTNRVHPDDRDAIVESFRLALESDKSEWTAEYRFLHKDGTYRDVTDRGTIVRHPDGRARRAVGAMADVSLTKAQEEALRASATQYQFLFEHNPHPMWVATIDDYRVLAVNDAAIGHYGYTREEFLSMTLIDLRPPEELPHFLSVMKAIDQRVPHSISYARHWKKNREIIDVDLTSHYITFNGTPARLTAALDVTARRAAEQHLNESRSNLRALIENTHDIVFSLDRNFRLLTFNTAFKQSMEAFGLDLQPGTDLHEIGDLDELRFWKPLLDRALDGERFDKEISFDQHGITREYEFSFNPIRAEVVQSGTEPTGATAHNHALEVTGVAVFIRDVTQARKDAQQLKMAMERAEEMNRLKTNFLANMSHELRTPMTAILGFSSLIIENSVEPVITEYASRIEKSGARLLETMNGILDLARIEAGRTTVHPVPVSAVSEIQMTVSMLTSLADAKGLKIDVVAPKDVTLKLDPHYFGQILTNLIGNAIKFTERGTISIRLIDDGPSARVLVEDSGIGIAPDFLPHIFEEFMQESHGYDRKYEGTGLGLTITKHLTTILGGAITVDSKKGVGTTFTLIFPVAHKREILAPITPQSTQQASAVPQTEIRRILVVEDNAESAEMAMIYLATYYRVDLCSTGEEAIELCQEHSYDVVLVDVGLGDGMNGLELTHKLRQNDRYAQIPIVAVTAYAMSRDRDAALEAGCTDFLSKPYTKKQLLGIVAGLLR